MLIRIAVMLAVVAVAGCASPKNVREDTRVVGLYVQTVKKDLEDFSRLRDLTTKARTANIVALELKTLRAEQAIARDLQSLDLIQDKERLQLLAALQNASALIVAQRKEYEEKSAGAKADVANAKSALNFQVSKLGDAAALLIKLSENRSLRDDARFYVDFIKQVRTHVEDDLKDGAKAVTAESVSKTNAMTK